jgi:hypothetical protein
MSFRDAKLSEVKGQMPSEVQGLKYYAFIQGK